MQLVLKLLMQTDVYYAWSILHPSYTRICFSMCAKIVLVRNCFILSDIACIKFCLNENMVKTGSDSSITLRSATGVIVAKLP